MADLSTVIASSLSALSGKSPKIAAVELAVLPSATRLSFRAREAEVVAACGTAFGVALPTEACRFAEAGSRTAIWLGPDEWMLVDSTTAPEALVALLDAALAGHFYALVDVSQRSEAISVTGPQAAALLNCFCPLDLSDRAFPVGMATRTIFGKSEIVLLRTAADQFRVDVWRSFAPYVWGMLEEARREFI